MKTKWVRITALFLAAAMMLMLAGCGKTSVSTEDVEPAKGPGFSDLVETDSLVLYIQSNNADYTMRWVNQFSDLYGINIEVVKVIGARPEYTERITNDLAVGSGPDVIFLSDLYYADIAKIAMNHNLLDLTDVLAEDPEFSETAYVDGVLEAGQFGGRQYMVPLMYDLPLMLSSTEKLEELGFSWDKVDTTSDFLEEIDRLTPAAQQGTGFQKMLDGKNRHYLLLPVSGIPLVDYETGEVLPDEKALKAYLEAYKLYFPYDYDAAVGGLIGGDGAKFLTTGQHVFWFPPAVDALTAAISSMKNNACDYTLQPIPGQDGEIVGDIRVSLVGINANSKNTLNAYRLLKFMLSEEVQTNNDFHQDGIPVHKEAIRQLVYEAPALEQVGNFEVFNMEKRALTEEEADEIYEMLTSVDRFTLGMPFMGKMVMDSMLPYFRDEDSYKNCLDELRSKLTFYLSE